MMLNVKNRSVHLRHVMRRFVFFNLIFFYLIQYLFRGIQFSRASLNGALT